MSSDAKIGLLLGLVFIFVIAFIINGLPSFRGEKDSNELTTRMAGLQNEPAGLGANERKAQESLSQTESSREQTTVMENQSFAADRREDVRSIIPIPGSDSVVGDILAGKTMGFSPSHIVQQGEQVKPSVVGPIAAETVDVSKPVSVVKVDLTKPQWPKSYIVADGDNLAMIAKKFYGEQEGNKKMNITRIFEANKNLLKSPDEVYSGQKLVIPALASLTEASKSPSIFSSSVFEKVKSIAPKQVSTDEVKPKPKPSGEYVVQEGDNLWRIATAKLGDGNRYKEISKLNADILKDEHNIPIGMRLKLPSR